MKKQLTGWLFNLMVTSLFLFGLLVTFMLSPILLYADKTTDGNYSIYHNKPLDKDFQQLLYQSNTIIQLSEVYAPKLAIDVCIKDGSGYPGMITAVMGKDFLSSFYNKIILTSDVVNYHDNYIQLDGHRWNMAQMLAHAQVHCLEFNRLGLWQSNPVASHPEWIWEGYPEYIARQSFGEANLKNNIQQLLQTENAGNNGWMKLADNTEVLLNFYEYRLLIQYCIEIRKMTFDELMKETTSANIMRKQMINWYDEHR